MITIIILSIVQGFTEFLPISSSGHLALLESLFKIKEPVALTAFLHFGTFLATLLFFRNEIAMIIKGLFKWESSATSYVVNIVIGNIPIVIFALHFRNMIEATFGDVKIVLVFLGMTGTVLLLTSLIPKGTKKVILFKAFIIGIGQMLAVFPGLSRSGLTISAGIFCGVNPDESFRFSFLLSLPAVLGANLLELKQITHLNNPVELITGMVISFVSGLIALKILRAVIQKWFYLFGFYCLIISVLFLLLII
ncbi:MAG: undecaprenyl-diphosphate phosphatase [bacterium]